MNRFSDPTQQTSLLRDVFLTGGNTLFTGFEDRLTSELRAVLPTDYVATVRRARDPILDAWRGAASWWAGSNRADRAAGTVSRAEYFERGSEYIKVCHVDYLLIGHSTMVADDATRNTTWGTRRRPHLPSGDEYEVR
jgi:hypothetical protein